MSTHFEQLATRRRQLQLRCAVQRGEIAETQAGIDAGAARADRLIAVAQRFTPLLLVAGVAVVLAVGPGRALGFARQGLVAAAIASRAARLLR
jgi:hypothetical protein